MAVRISILFIAKLLVAAGFALACLLILFTIALDVWFDLDGWLIWDMYREVVNFMIWLRRLPGQWFVRATHELNAFVAAYIRPVIYDLNFSVKEGKLNTWVHTLRRTKKKTCPICYDRRFKHLVVRFNDCGHEACTSCIREYINAQIDSGHTVFKCPLGDDCEDMPERVVHKVTRVDLDLLDKVERMYVRVGLAGCVDSFQCPSTDCGNAVFSDTQIEEASYLLEARLLMLTVRTAFATDLSGSDLRKFKCVNCGYSYCVLCSRVWDQGEYRNV